MSTPEPIRVLLAQEGDYAFRVEFEGTELAALLADEPAPLGGGLGPDPPRLLLAAIANCMAGSLLFALRKFRNAPGPVTAEIVATPMRNAEGRLRIPQVFVELRLPEGNEDYRQLDRVLATFEDFCTVTQSVRQGIDVQVTVKDAHERTLLGDKSFEAGA